jgi:MFS family permease
MSPYRVTLTLCGIEILGLISIAAFPALLPTFINEWDLSNTQAGWISAVYYAGNMLAVPFLVGLTDRVDARKIMIIGAFIGSIASLGFALFAVGFRSAAALRFLTGISLAGIYMPGLKVISDNTEGALQSRFVSFYTGSFSIGISLSFFIAGEINVLYNWRWVFGAAALCSAAAFILIVLFAPPAKIFPAAKAGLFLIEFRPIFGAKQALGYIFTYAAHMWELFGMRSWIVAFLYYSQSLQPIQAYRISATQIAFLVTLIGLPASICGNELARRFGRKQLITVIMLTSAVLCTVIGLVPMLPYGLVAGLCIIHGILVAGDSAALTAGAVAAAPVGYRGATLALHSTLGFSAALIGPLTVGVVLDIFSHTPTLSWAMAYACMGIGCALGPLFLVWPGRNE